MEVKLLSITPNGEELVASAFSICTNKNLPVENIQKWIKLGHLSPLEHASATFLIEGISRACLAQLTRHRLCSFSVRSMRYCLMNKSEVIVPQSIKDAGYEKAFLGVVGTSQKLYKNMVEWAHIPKEDSRMVLPIATITELIMTANARQWLHIFSQRCTPHAQWEVRQLCEKIREILYQEWPNIVKEDS